MPTIHYNWTRFWRRREGSSISSEGYLFVHPQFSKNVTSFDQISHIPCLVLLGEPGIGKTYALESEVKKQEDVLSITDEQVLHFNLRSFSSEERLIQEIFASAKIKDWINGTHRLNLFLDSLDEALLRIETLAALLIEKFTVFPVQRLKLRIACRTAEWSSFLETNLEKLWGDENFGAYELAPLRRVDVSIAAGANELDPETFLSEVAIKRAEPLAAKPVTLNLLLNLYQRHHALPSTQAELYERGCLLLCEEENEGRKGKWKLTARQRFRIASRIAAITMFGNKARIWLGSDTGEQTDSDVMISELAGAFEKNPDGTDFPTTENCVQEALYATGLFTSRGPNSLGWQHQTYAEFLAAWYLNYLNLDDRTPLKLLTCSDNSENLLVPQLYETAAWLASMRSTIFRALMESEPLILLRSDVLAADEAIRAELTSALLRTFEEEKEFDRWELRSYYSKLKHSGLAEQLRHYVNDKSNGVLVRHVAIDIVEECGVRELQNQLADVALDQKEDLSVRAHAANAVSELGNIQTKARLKPLAQGEAGEDPESELKGYGLLCVWPHYLSAQELFATLTDEPAAYGSYKLFLKRNLVPNLKTKDLSIALDWVRQKSKDTGAFDFDYKDLFSEIIVKSWEALDEETVLDSFVQLTLEKMRRFDDLLEEHDVAATLTAMRQDHYKRKRLLLRLFPLLTERTDLFGLADSILLRPVKEDVPWLLEEVKNNPASPTTNTVVLILKDLLRNWHGVLPEVLSLIHSALDQSDLLRNELSPFFEPMSLDAPEAQVSREAYEQSFMRKKRKFNHEEHILTPAPAERVAMMLAKFEKGDLDAWWQLNLEMSLKEGSKFYGNELEVDLTKLPGWITANEQTKTRIVDAAQKYTIEGVPNVKEWVGANTLYRPAFSGYRALWLLRDVDPAFIENLRAEVWRKWAPIIFHYPVYNGSGEDVYRKHREFIATAYRVVPDDIIQLLLDEISRFGEPNSFVDFERLEACWDERLLTALRRKLKEDDLHPQLFGRILALLIKHKDTETISYAHRLLGLPIPYGEAAARSLRAATSLFQYSQDAGWDSIWPAIISNAEFGRKAIESFVSPDRASVTKRLSESQIGDFYIWLSEQYPHVEDPQFPAGVAHFVGKREEIAHMRDSLLSHLKTRGTAESVKAIEKITTKLPHLDWLKWILLEARRNLRRHSWKPLSPNQIIDLRDSSSRPPLDNDNNRVAAQKRGTSLMLWDRPLADIPNLDELLDGFQRRPDGFAFFVGAGLSTPTFPVWDELLSRLVNTCDHKRLLSPEDKSELLQLLTQKKGYLDIASTCVSLLQKHDYRKFLEDQFYREVDVTKIPAYRELFTLRPDTIVTTNFDQIPDRLNGFSFSLDGTSTFSSSSHYTLFTNRNTPEANNAWKSGRPIIFKMHGCVTNHESIVFTGEDFRREIYRGPVNGFLDAIFRSRTVVFLGFGFSDPHIDSILSFLQDINSGLSSPHYVLTSGFTSIQQRSLERNYGVSVINYYSTPGHPQVVEFIRLLQKLKSEA